MTEPQRQPAARPTRKELGAWYTPPALVAALVRETVFDGARTVLDPACGDGRFLRATCLPEQTGVDIDASAGFIHDDSLHRDWDDEQFDIVIGNPPFLNQLSRLTSRGGSSKFGGGPYADAAAEFLALAIRLARPGGRVGFVLPQSLLATRDAAAIRSAVDGAAALRWMWWSDTQMFDASVRVWAGVWEVGGEQGEVRRSFGPDFTEVAPMPMPRTWSGLLTGTSAAAHDGPTLGTIATFAVDFRDQYYGLVGAVGDDEIGPPLITSGLIEPGLCLWGQRSVRFAKQHFDAPRVAVDRLSPALQKWAAARLVPKILIANQTKVIEAVHDVHGEWLPSVPVITCVTDEPEQVLAVLASAAANEWVHQHAAGSGLSATSVRLNPKLLASIPLR
ncbi:MAG TPA: N-6 DNA methylase [Ilumatobacteraceae bacterium]|nr:N-6 DNA methylase [Ilumatobacteraceae bacterium]HRB01983.1 N-6 DNA methylase [Ilumatobacteraceae bacterium]